MKQDNYCYPLAIPLNTYILDKHNGNTSAFARTQNVRHDQVTRWTKRNCVVIDGRVYCEVNTKNKTPD